MVLGRCVFELRYLGIDAATTAQSGNGLVNGEWCPIDKFGMGFS